ncbi:hypothetical protein FDP41_008708 [Naegleria fowleri]|uniref:Uncharacterized protein n=1 Tax=Naegleria fowleri TaxID=5763 RepID=A0A6A5BG80_NAEFO|nr:uncharacterized protein FDP41_008708 [Naegleria fowleri]KAF0973044.1 hypothetical protein FDP41_008708 [Naegleria fowleri]
MKRFFSVCSTTLRVMTSNSLSTNATRTPFGIAPSVLRMCFKSPNHYCTIHHSINLHIKFNNYHHHYGNPTLHTHSNNNHHHDHDHHHFNTYVLQQELVRKALEENDAESQASLGVAYYTGERFIVHDQQHVLKQDLSKAFQFLSMAAQQNHPGALFLLGNLYLEGVEGVVEKDEKKALHYWELAASLQQPQALFALGVMYLNSEHGSILNELGNDKEEEQQHHHQNSETLSATVQKGMHYLERAAELGSTDACFNLALLYHCGSVQQPKDLSKAIQYYERIANSPHGDAQAQFNLGCLYRERCIHNHHSGENDHQIS